MTIEQFQKTVDDWINENGVRYFNELTNMAMLTEEVGEVARIIARRRNTNRSIFTHIIILNTRCST